MPDDKLNIGLLAYQTGLIDQDTLIDAFLDWTKDQKRSLADVLLDQEQFKPADVAKLEDVWKSLPWHRPQRHVGDWYFSDASEDPLPATTVSDEHQFQTDIRRFRIRHRLDQGGLGIVFVATDQEFEREVALKQIRPELADNAALQNKFRREAELTGRLEHPGIVPIYALGHDDERRPYYAMRLIRGSSLRDSITHFHTSLAESRHGVNSPGLRQLLRRFIDICNTLEYAHRQGVLHRDLKPGNILLGDFGETFVVDWGLAKSMNDTNAVDSNSDQSLTNRSAETAHGFFQGTLPYASPEQLRGQWDKLSVASDVYSLGCILHQILTGQPPIQNVQSVQQALEQQAKLQNYSPCSLRADIPGALAHICCRALAMRPEDRYPDAASLREQIQLWLDDQAITGHREPFVHRGSRWLRHHPTLAATLAVGMLAMVALSVVVATAASRLAFVKEKSLAAEVKSYNDLLLSQSQLSRSRGQFRQAAQSMREIKARRGLTPQEELLLAQDQFAAQDAEFILNDTSHINRSMLSEAELAKLDLLEGDKRLMTSAESSGFKLVQQALDSKLLSEVDTLYAQALLADSVKECQANFRKCLRLDPLHMSALTKLAVTSIAAGDLKEAEQLVDFAQSLWPDDIRVLFLSGMLGALTDEKERLDKVASRFEALGNLSAEVKMLRTLASLRQRLEAYAVGTIPETQMWSEIGKLFVNLAEISLTKYATPNVYALPRLGWMGKLNKAFGANPFDITNLSLDITSLATQLLKSNKFENLHAQLPNHQIISYCLALTNSDLPRAGIGYKQFLEAQSNDVLSLQVEERIPWAGLLMAIGHSLQAKQLYDENACLQFLIKIQQLRDRTGRFTPHIIDRPSGFQLLLRSRMFSLALAMAEQEFELADDDQKAGWQRRIDATKELAKKYEQSLEAAFESISSNVSSQ